MRRLLAARSRPRLPQEDPLAADRGGAGRGGGGGEPRDEARPGAVSHFPSAGRTAHGEGTEIPRRNRPSRPSKSAGPLIPLTQAWSRVVFGAVEAGGGDGSAAGFVAGVR